jgi:glycosyltransferase involved in cell wall biosynthesis
MMSAEGATKKLLFICNDVLGTTMAGPGIRYWEMAHVLMRQGHECAILARHIENGFSSNDLVCVGKTSFLNLLNRVRLADVVIQPGRPMPILLSLLFRKQLIFDQYDPVIFEFLERKPFTLLGKMQKSLMLFLWRMRQRIILRFGDRFLVANEKQKDFLIGQMTIQGYRKKLVSVIVLPFGLPGAKPAKNRTVLRGTKIKDTDFLLVWGGGVWDWFDPFTLLLALAKIQLERNDIKAYFPGLRPPSPDSQKMTVVGRFLAEAERLNILDSSVFVNAGWNSYEQRADYLLEADAGISLHKDSLETRFAFRTRILDYLWAGLPIIASKGDCWADDIEQYGLGLTVAPGDVDAVATAIMKMADDKEFRACCREHVQLIAGGYTWTNLMERFLDAKSVREPIALR